MYSKSMNKQSLSEELKMNIDIDEQEREKQIRKDRYSTDSEYDAWYLKTYGVPNPPPTQEDLDSIWQINKLSYSSFMGVVGQKVKATCSRKINKGS